MSEPDGRPPRFARLVRRLLELTAWFSVHHPRTVVILALVATALALWSASDLRLSTDIDSLMPHDVPEAERLRDLFERYGSSEPIVLAISGRGEEDLDDRIDLALTISDLLETRPRLHGVTGLFGEDPWSLLEGPQASALMLYLEPEEIEQLASGLDRDGIRRRVARARERLRSPIGAVASRLVAEDPLGFVGVAIRHLGAIKGRLRIASRDGVLMTEDGAYVMLLVRAEGRTDDFAFAQGVLGELENIARQALETLGIEGTVGIGPPPEGAEGTLHVGLTGAPAILTDYRRILASDIRDISWGAFVAVMVLFLLAFRRVTALFVAGVPLAVGVAWALGFAGVAIGEISVFTAGSVAILCGLAIDFTIHLYNRYLEEIHAGHDMATAFAAAHGETGLGILAAAATTAWAFLAAGFSRFRGLSHLGVICAVGMLLALLASLLLVPAIVAIVARLRPRADRPRGLASFGLGPLLTLVTRHSRLTIALGLVATAVLVGPALRVHLDEDFNRFRPVSSPSIRLQQELVVRTGTSLRPVLAMIRGDDQDALLEQSARLEASFDDLVDEGGPLAAVLGPSRIVPPPSAQRRALATLRRLRAAGLDPARVERELLAAMEAEGFRIDARARQAAARVRAILARDAPLTVAEARRGPLGPVLGDLIIPDPRGGSNALVFAYPTPGIASRPLVDALRAAVAASGVDAELVGGQVHGQALRPIMRRDAVVAMALAAAGVLLILLAAFRRVVLVALTFVPLVVGLVASVGLMAWLGIDFNLVSLSMLPLILGIGIDNGIHVVHRWLSHRTEALADVFRHTGRGIVMTSLTTMVGFGAMMFADYPGLRSSGVLAILGVGATLVTAVTLLPALLVQLRIRDEKREQASADADR
ncbi:MAG: hypothetical protein Kow0062_21450 [Acidobacteriota bacterium]